MILYVQKTELFHSRINKLTRGTHLLIVVCLFHFLFDEILTLDLLVSFGSVDAADTWVCFLVIKCLFFRNVHCILQMLMTFCRSTLLEHGTSEPHSFVLGVLRCTIQPIGCTIHNKLLTHGCTLLACL